MHVLSRLKLNIKASWFDELTPEQQEQYVLEHPNSKYSKEYKARKNSQPSQGPAKGPSKSRIDPDTQTKEYKESFDRWSEEFSDSRYADDFGDHLSNLTDDLGFDLRDMEQKDLTSLLTKRKSLKDISKKYGGGNPSSDDKAKLDALVNHFRKNKDWKMMRDDLFSLY